MGQKGGLVCLCQKMFNGPDSVIRHSATMGGEDMSFFLREVPGCFFFIGSANPEKGLAHPHHNPRFDFDEDALGVGVEMLTRTVEYFFGRDKVVPSPSALSVFRGLASG